MSALEFQPHCGRKAKSTLGICFLTHSHNECLPAVRGVALAKGPNTPTDRSGWPGSGGLENNDFYFIFFLELMTFTSFSSIVLITRNEAEFLMNMQEGERVSAEGTSQRCVSVTGES